MYHETELTPCILTKNSHIARHYLEQKTKLVADLTYAGIPNCGLQSGGRSFRLIFKKDPKNSQIIFPLRFIMKAP